MAKQQTWETPQHQFEIRILVNAPKKELCHARHCLLTTRPSQMPSLLTPFHKLHTIKYINIKHMCDKCLNDSK